MLSALSLLLLRVTSVTIAVAINILIIKLLPLREVGNYYILGTIAYFGNALFFVGFDLALQKKMRNIYKSKTIDYSSLLIYHIQTLPLGAFAAFALSLVVSFFNDSPDWISTSLLCAALSATTFTISLSRNILLLAGEKYRVSYSMLLEQFAKLTTSSMLLVFWENSARSVILAFLAGGLLCLVFNYTQIARCMYSSPESIGYAVDKGDLRSIFFPVSAGGVLNWFQLQGYRPILGTHFNQAELVGTVSFLTTLGATATSAILSVLGQIWTPKQFSTSGLISRQYTALAGTSVFFLTLLSYPAAYLALRLLGKESLYGLEYLVSLGVIVEGGNFILGLLGNHSSLTRGSFVPSMYAGLIGLCTLLTTILILHQYLGMTPGMVGFCLAISQVIAVATLLPVLYRIPR